MRSRLHCLLSVVPRVAVGAQIDRLTNGWNRVEIDATVTSTLLVKRQAHSFCLSNRDRSSATQLPFSDTAHRDEKKHWTRLKKNLPRLCTPSRVAVIVTNTITRLRDVLSCSDEMGTSRDSIISKEYFKKFEIDPFGYETRLRFTDRS